LSLPSRILVLTPALDGMDGISEVSRQLVGALTCAVGRQAIEVWTLDGGWPLDGLAPTVQFGSARGVKARLGSWVLARATRRLDDLLVVVLHVHLAPVAMMLAARGATVACFLQGIESWRPLRARDRAALGRVTMLLAISRWTAERFRAANPAFADAAIEVCHLGVGPVTQPELPAIRDYALIVGRMSAEERYKGHEALLDVWPDVTAASPGARLVMVGDGDDRARLEEIAASRGLKDHVHFTGRVSNGALEGFYRNSAFFVMPSVGEGFGLAYVEAMRAGKACIAAPGAAAEIVTDGVTGLIVDPSSRPALTEAIIRLFCEPDTRDAMGRAGAARVVDQFEHRHFAARVIAALQTNVQLT
jgi:phosphatidylinositol alpha-1,6-mannosyltransferase